MVVLLSCDTFWAWAALFTLAWCFRQSIIMVWFTILKAALKCVRKRTAQPELTVRKIVSNELNSWKQTTFHIQVCCYHSNGWDRQCYEQQQGYGNGSKTAENCIIFRRRRPIACMKQDATAPVATELFTVEMTLGPTISRNPLRRLVGVMSRGRLEISCRKQSLLRKKELKAAQDSRISQWNKSAGDACQAHTGASVRKKGTRLLFVWNRTHKTVQSRKQQHWSFV